MVAPLVDSVLLSNSAFNQTGVEEWELELKECEHTKNLDQSNAKVVTAEDKAKCEECELGANLWMCMHCGHLGCGRKNWDGSGANHHAIEHGEKTGHSVVCKMGTITPEGKASIYCYKCDNDVLDEKLG